MNPQDGLNGLTAALVRIRSVLDAGGTRVNDLFHPVLMSLVGLEIALIFLWAGFGMEQLGSLIKKFAGLLTGVAVVQYGPRLAKALVQSLARAGLVAGGSSEGFAFLQDPSRIAAMGAKITEPVMLRLHDMPWYHADKLIYTIVYIILWIPYLVVAWHMFFAIIEYYLFVSLSGALLVFIVVPSLRFIADKAINVIVGSGIKLMVMGFLLAATEPILKDIRFTNFVYQVSWNQIWSVILVAWGLGYALIKAPSMASSMIHGSPGMSGAPVVLGFASVVTNFVTRVVGARR